MSEGSTAGAALAGMDVDVAELEKVYVDLHAQPELSMQEHRTAGIVAKRPSRLGYKVTEGVSGTMARMWIEASRGRISRIERTASASAAG